jgi:glycerol-3-phosphate dehydrogenase (NAD(P)+)
MANLSRSTFRGSTPRRATVVGAGSFGTAVAMLLVRAGVRTTLQARTAAQAAELQRDGENHAYLPGVTFPRELRIETSADSLERAELVLLAVPSIAIANVIAELGQRGLRPRTPIVSLAKGLVAPSGAVTTSVSSALYGAERVAVIGGPAHADELVHDGGALVAASTDEQLAGMLAHIFTRGGVICEISNDPLGVEYAGAAKNAAALASGATEVQGLNAAGAAAGHIFQEIWRLAESQGGRPESMIGLAGTGDLVATALAPGSRNRRAGELLGAGVPAVEIPERIGQAVEALESVPMLAKALADAGIDAPVTEGLSALISGQLSVDDWTALVRTSVPPPALWRRRVRPGFWARLRARLSRQR